MHAWSFSLAEGLQQDWARLTDVSTEALQTQVGSKDGQQLFIRENDGSVTAHLWSSSTGQWNLVCMLDGYWYST